MHIERLTEADWQTNEALGRKVNELVEELRALRAMLAKRNDDREERVTE